MSRPHCDGTGFGWIEIDGERYEHDVLIRLDGKIKRRKKKLSKLIYGTSHVISRPEAEHVFEDGARVLIIGTGQDGCVHLSPEAAAYLEMHEPVRAARALARTRRPRRGPCLALRARSRSLLTRTRRRLAARRTQVGSGPPRPHAARG